MKIFVFDTEIKQLTSDLKSASEVYLCLPNIALQKQLSENFIRTYDISDVLKSFLPEANRKISKFISECHLKKYLEKIEGNNFPSKKLSQKGLLWCFNFISEKNYPVCNIPFYYASAIVIKEKTSPNEKFDIIASDCELASILKQMLKLQNVRYTNSIKFMSYYIYSSLRQLKIWLTIKKQLPDNKPSQTKINTIFLSYIPLIWKKIGEKWKDRYLHYLPKTHGRKVPVSYLFTVRGEAVSSKSSLIKEVIKKTKTILNNSIFKDYYFLENYLSLKDIIIVYIRSSIIIFKYLCNKQIRKKMIIDEINLWPAIQKKFELSLIQTPEYILNIIASDRFIQEVYPNKLISYCFEFRWCKSILFSAIKNNIKTIGLQHGPFTEAKGLYSYFESEFDESFLSVLPEKIITDGSLPKEILCRYNTSLEKRIFDLGAPRFDGLANKLNSVSPSNRTVSSDIKLVVTPGHTDTFEMINFLKKCVLNITNKNIILILKSHPLVGNKAKEYFFRVFKNIEKTQLIFETRDIHELICEADILVCTYSSCGVEALVLKKPVMCFELPGKQNMSQLVDVKGFDGFVKTPKDFKFFIDNYKSHLENAEKLSVEIEKMFFNKLDGKSTDRILTLISEL